MIILIELFDIVNLFCRDSVILLIVVSVCVLRSGPLLFRILVISMNLADEWLYTFEAMTLVWSCHPSYPTFCRFCRKIDPGGTRP